VHVGVGLVGALDGLADPAYALGGLVEFFGDREGFLALEFRKCFAVDVSAVGFEGTALAVLRVIITARPGTVVAGFGHDNKLLKSK